MKQVTITPEIRSALEASLGEGVSTDGLVVFESVSANLLPLRRAQGLYNRARFTESLLSEMVEVVGKESIPLQVMHDTSTLPSGRVFTGRVQDEQLHTLFFLDPSTDGELVAKINKGVIDQVSVGLLPKHVRCSECGFDYMGEDSDWENLYELTCNEGHQIGVDGVHVRLSGVDSWFEQSLVGKGAVDGARIVGASKSAFADRGSVYRMAAGLFSINTAQLTEEPTMDLKDFTTQLTASATAAAEANVKVTTLTADLATRDAKITALEADITARDTKITDLEAAQATADGEALTAATAVLTDIATKMAVALGETDATIPTDVDGLKAFIESKQVALSALIPDKQISKPGGDNAVKATLNASAYTTRS
jgi:hypothetical protein